MMVTKPLTLESQGLRTKKSANKIGVHPMGTRIQSVLNVTIVRDDASRVEAVEIPDWTIEEETGSLPAALWEPGEPNMRPSEPTSKLVDGCITGIKRLKPKRGALGKKATPPPIDWNPLAKGAVPRSDRHAGETCNRRPSATFSNWWPKSKPIKRRSLPHLQRPASR